jgi:hypothetical protein
MAINHYIQLDGKKYRVIDDGKWAPVFDRQKTYNVGLTGKSILQDFTRSDGAGGERMPRQWIARLRVFITTPLPDASFGIWTDLLAAYNKLSITFIEHDDSLTHTVGIESPVAQLPRVGANINGECNGEFWIDVRLPKIYV